MEQKIHQGRNVKRFREMLNIKQEALAYDLGEDWNQKKISMLEQKDIIEESLLKQISAILKIPVEAFQNFDEEKAVNVIANTFGIMLALEIQIRHSTLIQLKKSKNYTKKKLLYLSAC